MVELCGGVASQITLAGRIPRPGQRIVFPWSEVKRLTGLELDSSEMAGILESLGFELANVAGTAGEVVVKAPSFRPDVECPADLVEEIVRIAGLDRVAPVQMPRA